MALILDRYASAIRSSDMRSKPETVHGDSDIVGAAGLAARRHDLALALQRLFSGDNGAADALVELLAGMAWGKAHKLRIRIYRSECLDLARAVLAWHRDGRCRHCRGHGFLLMPSTPVIGTDRCRHCRGTGRVPFDKQFAPPLRMLAQWLIAEVEREQCVAGPAVMRALAARMDL